MIQDIAPHKYDVTYIEATPKEQDVFLVCCGEGVLCRETDQGVVYPTAAQIAEAFPLLYAKAYFLFRIDGQGYFGLPGQKGCVLPGFSYLPKGRLRYIRPVFKAFAGITGIQICNWYLANQFCGRCGQPMQLHGAERAMRCVTCGKISYPQICPSVIVGVLCKGRILLTKYAVAHSSFRNYALVAGYVEVGESLEDAVRREVMEEVGLSVRNIRYYKSQPWPFSDALLAGFFCEVDGSAQMKLDLGELSEAGWFGRSAVPKERSEAEISLTGEMIEAFCRGDIF